MGYNTEFIGILKISPELTASQLSYLSQFLGEDCREHPEWEQNEFNENLDYIDLRLTKDFAGLEWDNESEKTYGMIDAVNYIISQMRDVCKDFSLSGEFFAQGEEMDDKWKLIINNNGYARKVNIIFKGKKITCPHCDKIIFLEEGRQ